MTTPTTTLATYDADGYYLPTPEDWQEFAAAMDARDAEEEIEVEEDWTDDDGYTDLEADAMTLRDAGYDTDEDYGFFGED